MRTAAVLLLATAALPAQVKLPPYTRQVLPNGVVVDLMPKRGIPLVEFRVMIKGGVEAEPPELAGVASVTAQLLRKGTSRRSAEQFSEDLDFLGGSFQAGQGFGDQYAAATTVSAEFLKKDLERGLDLVSDAVLNPTFPEAEVSKLIAQRVDAAKAAKDNPQFSAFLYFQAFFFGPKHPYGHPADELTLPHIRRQDIVDFHRRLYCGRNMVVIVTGDFDPAFAAPKIMAAFGQAPAGNAWAQPAAVALNRSSRLLLVDKPDATQTYFLIGQPGVDRRSPDRPKLLILNTLFGGRFTSMLNEELRVSNGLSYGASSSIQQVRLPGSILISSFTKTETTGRAIDLALDVLKRLGEKGITADQLASAKAYIKGTYPPEHLETSDQLAAVLSDMELYGLGRDEVDDFFSRIDAVTLDQANEAARKYFKSAGLTFVVLGNAAKIRDAVAKYSPDVVERKIATPGWNEEMSVQHTLPPSLPLRRVSQSRDPDADRVKALVDRGIAAARQQHYAEARDLYRAALRLDPDNPDILLNLALAHFKDNDLKGAIPVLEKIVKQRPNNEQAATLLGISYFGAGDFRRASAVLENIPAAHSNPELRRMLSQSYVWSGEMDKAARELDGLLRDSPDSAAAHVLLGQAYDAQGRAGDALNEFQAAARIHDAEPNVHFAIGFLNWRDKRYDEAEPEFRRELALDPAHSQAMAYLGDIELQRGNEQQAQALLAKALALRDDIRVAHYDLGVLAQKRGDHQDAVRRFNRAVELAPDRTDAHYRLATSYRAIGLDKDAEEQLAIVRGLHDRKADESLYKLSRPQ